MNQARIQPFKPQHPDERFRSPASAIARDFSGGGQRLTRCDPREPAWPQSAGVIFERVVVSCIVSWLHFVYGAAIDRRSSVMHRAPFSAWQGVMVPHVMWCAGHRLRSTDAASRPCSIDGGCLAALFDQCRSLAGLCGRERCFACTANLFLKIQETRHAAVCVSFGSLMVHRQQWDTYWGAKKFNFLIRDIDDATRAGASMESCRFVVLRSPWGRLGSY